jgi:hypothetical protein
MGASARPISSAATHSSRGTQAETGVPLRDGCGLDAELGEAVPDRARIVLALLLEHAAPLAATVGLVEQAAHLFTELVLLRREIEVHDCDV